MSRVTSTLELEMPTQKLWAECFVLPLCPPCPEAAVLPPSLLSPKQSCSVDPGLRPASRGTHIRLTGPEWPQDWGVQSRAWDLAAVLPGD